MTMLLTISLTVVATVLLVAVAMNFATSEKKLSRGLTHHAATADPQFRREMSVMLGPTLLAGNHVESLQNGAEIFPAMLGAIAEAKHTVTFETFIYWSGDIGGRFADALADAARRGVAVHVIVDWVGSLRMDDDLLQSMKSAGVHVQSYRPLRWYHLGRMNNRTHRKLLVVDGRIGFTGGVGIADNWKGDATDAKHWRDTHYRVTGPVVAQMQGAFNDNWIKSTGEVLRGEGFFPALIPTGALDAHVFLGSPAMGGESMHLMFLMAVTSATKRVDLAAAYFVPDPLLIEALLAARARGVDVRILVPGEHTDSMATRLASKACWGDLLQSGITIHVFQPTMLHTKLLVIDTHFVSVGSTNVDLRSFTLNDEACLNVLDDGFAAAMTDVFEQDLERAAPFTWSQWNQRPWLERVAERLVVPLRSQL